MATKYKIHQENTAKYATGNDFYTDLKSAVKNTNFDKGEKIYEYCSITNRKLWEVCIDKRYLVKP